MKKQLLLIVSIVFLALFAGISSASAQCAVAGSGLTPSVGSNYYYTVAIPNTTGYDSLTGTYDWYITQDVNLLLASAIIPELPTTAFTVLPGGSTYHNAGATTFTLGLKWESLSVTQTYYLVLRYTGNNSNGPCPAENIRVWQINPNNTTNFLLAITGAHGNDGSVFANANQCASPLLSAIVAAGGTSVMYTYDTSTVYYRVVASGVTGLWQPSIQLPALNAALNQNYAAVDWNADMTGAGTWNAFDTPSPIGTSALASFSSTNSATVTDSINGTPILVRVRIANVNFETLADQTINVGIDGLLPTGQSDIWGPLFPPNNQCDPATAFAKNADYLILARPTINAVTGTFITKLP
jgi:hypothetical protein